MTAICASHLQRAAAFRWLDSIAVAQDYPQDTSLFKQPDTKSAARREKPRAGWAANPQLATTEAHAGHRLSLAVTGSLRTPLF